MAEYPKAHRVWNQERGRNKENIQEEKKRLNAHDLYQQGVGECGIYWRDYLYELEYWQILLQIRGYRRRNILQYQLQRIQAFSSMFAFSGNKEHKQPQDIIPLYFDDYKDMDDDEPPMTDEEAQKLQAEMAAINKNGGAFWRFAFSLVNLKHISVR